MEGKEIKGNIGRDRKGNGLGVVERKRESERWIERRKERDKRKRKRKKEKKMRKG